MIENNRKLFIMISLITLLLGIFQIILTIELSRSNPDISIYQLLRKVYNHQPDTNELREIYYHQKEDTVIKDIRSLFFTITFILISYAISDLIRGKKFNKMIIIYIIILGVLYSSGWYYACLLSVKF